MSMPKLDICLTQSFPARARRRGLISGESGMGFLSKNLVRDGIVDGGAKTPCLVRNNGAVKPIDKAENVT